MPTIIVVDDPARWPLDIPRTEVVSAREYLTDRRFFDMRRATVFNLCRTYGYQTVGYYASLLAVARGHRPFPSVKTIQDLRQAPIVRVASEEVEAMLQRTLAPLKGDTFELSIYFGRNMAKRYDRLCQTLFSHFPAPLLRAEFQRNGQWRMHRLRLIATDDIPDSHRDFVIRRAQKFFARPRIAGPKQYRYDLAILFDSNEVDAPSDERAIQRFVRAAERLGIGASVIRKEDYSWLPEFDALFIRETTAVDHHTYRFASRAAAEGLIVIDDPESIVRCTNKVYQAELFERHAIPCPKTLVVHRENAATVGSTLGFPCVLKRPDSSFSAGVVKAETREELVHHLATFFRKSELVVAQEFVRSDFDWRIGILDGVPLFVCKYHMARGHWQIQKAESATKRRYGRVETLPVREAPPKAVEVAVRAAGFVGRGLYGVDIKEVAGRFLVMEINDNPNVESDCEDAIIKDELYLAVMQTFLARLDARGQARAARPLAESSRALSIRS